MFWGSIETTETVAIGTANCAALRRPFLSFERFGEPGCLKLLLLAGVGVCVSLCMVFCLVLLTFYLQRMPGLKPFGLRNSSGHVLGSIVQLCDGRKTDLQKQHRFRFFGRRPCHQPPNAEASLRPILGRSKIRVVSFSPL